MTTGFRHLAVGRAGFSLIELLIVLTMGGLIVGAVVNMLAANSQLFLSQRAVLDTHNTIRSATTPLVWELRGASASGGDLYAIDSTSLTLRSQIASGVVCATDVPNARYGLTAMAGEYAAGSADSAFVFILGESDWKRIAVSQIGAPATLGSPTACVYAGAPAPQVAIELAPAAAADTGGIRPGSPVTLFRRVQYGLVAESGTRWLKRKEGTAGWETVAGPLAPGGLRFSYFDTLGATTTDPSLVTSVDILVIGQGYGGPDVAPEPVRLRAFLRN